VSACWYTWDLDGTEPTDEPEQLREPRVRTRPDGTITLNRKLDPAGGARVLAVLNSLNRQPPGGASNAWPPPHYATPWRNATKGAPFLRAIAHPVIATAITLPTGSTGARPNLTICAERRTRAPCRPLNDIEMAAL
jgi:hypothetical protein